MNGVRVILVAPKFAGNVGATARVAANFGVTDLRVVSPRCSLKSREAIVLAQGPSLGVLENIGVHDGLASALEGCHSALAVSRRVGGTSPELLAFRDMPGWLRERTGKGKTVSLVFGREDFCLYREETDLCSSQMTLVTSDIMPTMNLSHAVAVVLCAVYTSRPDISVARPPRESAELGEVERLMTRWGRVMEEAGFKDARRRELTRGRIARVLRRADLSGREVGLLHGFLSRVEIALGERRRVGHNSATPSCSASIRETILSREALQNRSLKNF